MIPNNCPHYKLAQPTKHTGKGPGGVKGMYMFNIVGWGEDGESKGFHTQLKPLVAVPVIESELDVVFNLSTGHWESIHTGGHGTSRDSLFAWWRDMEQMEKELSSWKELEEKL